MPRWPCCSVRDVTKTRPSLPHFGGLNEYPTDHRNGSHEGMSGVWWSAVVMAGGVYLYLVHRRRTAREDHWRAWLRDQQRREMAKGWEDGVCWRWPIQKAQNEQAAWNRAKLKKRA